MNKKGRMVRIKHRKKRERAKAKARERRLASQQR